MTWQETVVTALKENWLPVLVLGLLLVYVVYREMKKHLLVRAAKKAAHEVEKPLEDVLKKKGFDGSGERPEDAALAMKGTLEEFEQRIHLELQKVSKAIDVCEKDMVWRKQLYEKLKTDQAKLSMMLDSMRRAPNK